MTRDNRIRIKRALVILMFFVAIATGLLGYVSPLFPLVGMILLTIMVIFTGSWEDGHP